MRWFGALWLLMGLGLIVLGLIPGVTDFMDAHSTPDSDPAGPVLVGIGATWMLVGVGLTLGGALRGQGLDTLRAVFRGLRAPSAPANGEPDPLATTPSAPPPDARSHRLAQLERLRSTGLVSETEYAETRARIEREPRAAPEGEPR